VTVQALCWAAFIQLLVSVLWAAAHEAPVMIAEKRKLFFKFSFLFFSACFYCLTRQTKVRAEVKLCAHSLNGSAPSRDSLGQSLGQLQPYITGCLDALGVAIQQRAISDINDWLVCLAIHQSCLANSVGL